MSLISQSDEVQKVTRAALLAAIEEAVKAERAWVEDGGKWEDRALKAEAEVEAFRFFSGEFCQGDETAEDAAHAMFDAVVKHRTRALAAEARAATAKEGADALRMVLRTLISTIRGYECESFGYDVRDTPLRSRPPAAQPTPTQDAKEQP